MAMETLIYEKIKSICQDTLRGTLDLESFYQTWPANAKGPLLDRIYEDIEFGVEHMPGFLFRKGVNQTQWRSSPEYLDIYFDYLLISHREKGINETLLLRAYDKYQGARKLKKKREVEMFLDNFLKYGVA